VYENSSGLVRGRNCDTKDGRGGRPLKESINQTTEKEKPPQRVTPHEKKKR